MMIKIVIKERLSMDNIQLYSECINIDSDLIESVTFEECK